MSGTLDPSLLRAYQLRGANFVVDNPNCALWLDMGLGKCVTTATAFVDLQESFVAQKMLVIGPLRVVRKTWPDEIARWSHLSHLRVSKIIGNAYERCLGLNADADVHLINQENVQWLYEQFVIEKKQVRRWPWDVVVIDESQGFRNQSSKRFKALKRLRRLFRRCVQLTGTPAPNGYENLWSQIFLLDGGKRLGASQKAFFDRWFYPEHGDGYVQWHLKEHSPEQIQAAVSDIVLTMRAEDYLTLPPVLYNPVRVALSPAALATYRKFAKTYIAQINVHTITAASAGACNGKLMQLANGSIYVDDKGNFELFHDEKIDALLETLDGASGPIVIGYAFRADASRIAKALDKFCGKERKWAFAESDADLEKFARGELDYIVMHPASAGHGLNDMHLSGSTTIVWFGLTNNLEHFQQLNARLIGGIRRIGKNIVIHMIVADGTVDERMVELLAGKAKTQDDLTKALVALSKEK